MFIDRIRNIGKLQNSWFMSRHAALIRVNPVCPSLIRVNPVCPSLTKDIPVLCLPEISCNPVHSLPGITLYVLPLPGISLYVLPLPGIPLCIPCCYGNGRSLYTPCNIRHDVNHILLHFPYQGCPCISLTRGILHVPVQVYVPYRGYPCTL